MSETKMEILNPFDKLNTRFEEMSDDVKLEFCRQVRDQWSKAIRQVYAEVLRDFQNQLAFNCPPEEILQWRLAAKQLTVFEDKINFFIAYLQNFSDDLKQKSENKDE